MLIVALTGGIATGKSVVARIFEELGCYIHRADQVAHALMKPDAPAWGPIVEHFGTGILRADRTIDRDLLGARVFARAEDRMFLNRLLHPLVLEEKKEAIARLEVQGHYRIFVSEAALTIEAGLLDLFHKVVVTYCSRELQIQRLRQRGGTSRREALQKIRSQMPAKQKLAYGDYIIHTGGNLTATIEQAERVYRHLHQDYRLMSSSIEEED